MLIRARHYGSGQKVEILWEEGIIRALGPVSQARVDLEAGWMAPALFDLQINGAGGHSFNSQRLDLDSIRHVVQVCRGHGIGSFCPTLVTNSFAALHHGMSTLQKACAKDAELARSLPAVHLEGPYISAEDGPRGAHPRQFVRNPDWDEFRRLQDAAGGRIRLVTLAPELEGALTFIERLSAAGVIVALGHTAASPACIQAAIRAGARLSTHLGNGSHALLPRHENYLWEQLAADALWASIICDGHHLPASLLRCLVRVKTPARLILTCDASSLAGVTPGRYREWDQDFEVLPGGKVTVAGTGFLAGSGVFTDVCIGNVIRFAGVSLQEAVDMASARPRALLGLPPVSLEPGRPADLVLFDWQEGGDFKVVRTIVCPTGGGRGSGTFFGASR
jgi:N-acetylglucosamine-6-phosphate deacetylase